MLIVISLARAGEVLVVAEGTHITMMTREAFDNILLYKPSNNYDNYGLVRKQCLGLGLKDILEEVEQMHCKCLKSKLVQLASMMTSMMERLVGRTLSMGSLGIMHQLLSRFFLFLLLQRSRIMPCR